MLLKLSLMSALLMVCSIAPHGERSMLARAESFLEFDPEALLDLHMPFSDSGKEYYVSAHGTEDVQA